MNTPSFWHFALVGTVASGVSRIAASVVASSSLDSVSLDLESQESILKRGIDIYFSETAEALAARDPKTAEVLLAGLCALDYFGLKFQVWTAVHPPAGTQVSEPSSEANYVYQNGVKVWIIKASV